MELNGDFDSESEDDGLSFGLEDEETTESEDGYLTDQSTIEDGIGFDKFDVETNQKNTKNRSVKN